MVQWRTRSEKKSRSTTRTTDEREAGSQTKSTPGYVGEFRRAGPVGSGAGGAIYNAEGAFFKFSTHRDTLKQRAHVEELVSSKVNLIVISPQEAQPLTEPVAKAMAAGVPVIVLDRALLGDKFTCFIGANNKKIGKAAGEWIVRALGSKGNVVELMGLQTSTPGQDRHTGFLEGISGSEVKVIFSADMKWLEPDARKEMESALSRFDRIDLVYGHNDSAAHGAYLAAKAAGREGIQFVGIDALPQEGVADVSQGILVATFQYPTGGAEAIEVARKILKGEPVPKEIVLGTRLFDRSNVKKGRQQLK